MNYNRVSFFELNLKKCIFYYLWLILKNVFSNYYKSVYNEKKADNITV